MPPVLLASPGTVPGTLSTRETFSTPISLGSTQTAQEYELDPGQRTRSRNCLTFAMPMLNDWGSSNLVTGVELGTPFLVSLQLLVSLHLER